MGRSQTPKNGRNAAGQESTRTLAKQEQEWPKTQGGLRMPAETKAAVDRFPLKQVIDGGNKKGPGKRMM